MSFTKAMGGAATRISILTGRNTVRSMRGYFAVIDLRKRKASMLSHSFTCRCVLMMRKFAILVIISNILQRMENLSLLENSILCMLAPMLNLLLVKLAVGIFKEIHNTLLLDKCNLK